MVLPERSAASEFVVRMQDHGASYANIDFHTPWLPILVRLADMLDDVVPGYVVLQVKAKFGELRFYYSLPQDTLPLDGQLADSMVRWAELRCAEIDAEAYDDLNESGNE